MDLSQPCQPKGGDLCHQRVTVCPHVRTKLLEIPQVKACSGDANLVERGEDEQVTYPLLLDPAGWPALHAQGAETWRSALTGLSRAWGLRDAWERLPGGEDSVVFAQGGTVAKIVPPFLAAAGYDLVRDRLSLMILDLPFNERSRL